MQGTGVGHCKDFAFNHEWVTEPSKGFELSISIWDLGPRPVMLVTTFRMDNKRTGVEGERRLGAYCHSPGGGWSQYECRSECGENGEVSVKR